MLLAYQNIDVGMPSWIINSIFDPKVLSINLSHFLMSGNFYNKVGIGKFLGVSDLCLHFPCVPCETLLCSPRVDL